jgi:ubiquinone biosynthesis accessory factor UbiK
MHGLCQKFYYLYISIAYELTSLLVIVVTFQISLNFGATHHICALLCAVTSARNALDFGLTLHSTERKTMALKPPPPWEILQHVSDLVGGSGVKQEVDKNMRSLAQSALTRLDVVSREEFDAQVEILKRTRDRVATLEAALEELTRELETLTGAQ